jgi:tetratricopeptide (TPR) repeat protein
MLAGRGMPAAVFVEAFHPDWQTLREIWARYRENGSRQDLDDLVAYAATVTERQAQEKEGIPPAYLWLFQAAMYTDLERPGDALVCLEKAYRAGPHLFAVRFAVGRSLLAAGRYAEAEAHVRWCLARRPENKGLSAALVEITKQRIAQRTADDSR